MTRIVDAGQICQMIGMIGERLYVFIFAFGVCFTPNHIISVYVRSRYVFNHPINCNHELLFLHFKKNQLLASQLKPKVGLFHRVINNEQTWLSAEVFSTIWLQIHKIPHPLIGCSATQFPLVCRRSLHDDNHSMWQGTGTNYHCNYKGNGHLESIHCT